jgi:hypothetical protein
LQRRGAWFGPCQASLLQREVRDDRGTPRVQRLIGGPPGTSSWIAFERVVAELLMTQPMACGW